MTGRLEHPGQLPPRRYTTKGASTSGQKIHGKSSLVDINQRGKVIKNGLHLSKHLPDSFFERLSNEVPTTTHQKA